MGIRRRAESGHFGPVLSGLGVVCVSKLRLIGLTAAVLVLALVLIGQEGSPQPIALPGVAVRDLECLHMKLLVPDEAPKVSAEQARESAKMGGPFDLPVQHVALARFVEDSPEGPLHDNLVWAVVSGDGTVHQFDGPGGPLRQEERVRTPSFYTYALALVDASTGDLIFGMLGPPSPEYTCP